MTRQDYVERWLGEALLKGKKVSVLVEGLGDQAFWTTILSHTIPHLQYRDIDFPFYSPQGTMGKDAIMPYENYVCKELIICRDSDNVWLYEPNTSWLNQPFIYQTYTYTKENHLCHAENLNKTCRDLTQQLFDFQDFIQQYSKAVFPVLLNWLHFFPTNDPVAQPFISLKKGGILHKVLSITEDLAAIKTLSDLTRCIHLVTERVQEWLEGLKRELGYEVSNDSYNNVLRQEDAIFYLSGHIVVPEVVEPLFQKVVNFLQLDYETILRQELFSAKETVIQNRMEEYRNQIKRMDIATRFQENYKEGLIVPFSSSFMTKIKEDIIRDFCS